MILTTFITDTALNTFAIPESRNLKCSIGIEGGKLFISKIEQLDNDSIKAGVEFLSNKLGESVIVLVSPRMVLAKVSDSMVAKGISAGKIVGEIAKASGANGGGRPNFAQGGIKDISLVDDVLLKIESELK